MTDNPTPLHYETHTPEPMRCAECDCEHGGPDCNWIGHPTTGALSERERQALPETLTAAQLDDACLSFRHDFGLLDVEQREAMRRQAADWWRCFSRALATVRGQGQKPTIEARYDDEGELDEVVASGVNVHIERLDDGAWWIGMDHPCGRVDHVTLTSGGAAPVTSRFDGNCG